MATTIKVELKEGVEIGTLVGALKKAAADNGIDFKGDNKSGSGSKSGAEVKYTVEGNTVTITCDTSFPASMKYSSKELSDKVKEWLKPYIK